MLQESIAATIPCARERVPSSRTSPCKCIESSMCAARARTPTRGSRLRASADSNGPREGRVGWNVVSTTATCARTPNARRDRRIEPEQRVHSSRAGHVSPSPHTRRGSDACVRQPRQTRHVSLLPDVGASPLDTRRPGDGDSGARGRANPACPTPHPSLRPAALAPAPRPPRARRPLVTHTSSGRAAPAARKRKPSAGQPFFGPRDPVGADMWPRGGAARRHTWQTCPRYRTGLRSPRGPNPGIPARR